MTTSGTTKNRTVNSTGGQTIHLARCTRGSLTAHKAAFAALRLHRRCSSQLSQTALPSRSHNTGARPELKPLRRTGRPRRSGEAGLHSALQRTPSTRRAWPRRDRPCRQLRIDRTGQEVALLVPAQRLLGRIVQLSLAVGRHGPEAFRCRQATPGPWGSDTCLTKACARSLRLESLNTARPWVQIRPPWSEIVQSRCGLVAHQARDGIFRAAYNGIRIAGRQGILHADDIADQLDVGLGFEETLADFFQLVRSISLGFQPSEMPTIWMIGK